MVKIVEQSFEIMSPINGKEILKHLELCIRNCYKSEDKISDGTAEKMVKTIIDLHHDAMIEHYSVSVKFTTDLSFYKDVTRHRMASYAIESTRYCMYSRDKFGSEITVIKPCNIAEDSEAYKEWLKCMEDIERAYLAMAKLKCTPDQCRMLLPHSVKADMIMTANLREWRHVFKLRADKRAHPGIQVLMKGLLKEFMEKIPVVFDDLKYLLD